MSSTERPEGLPSSWTIQVKSSDGEKHECYTDPETGREFHSMLEVSDYLNTLNSSKSTEKTGDNPKPTSEKVIPENPEPADVAVAVDISEDKQETNQNSSGKKVTLESGTPVDGLPEGWIREILIRRSKGRTRKDWLYLDPSSDYAFWSKKDALRYLETGSIEKCAMKPKKKSEIEMMNTPAKEKKSTNTRKSKSNSKSTATPSPKKLKMDTPETKEKEKGEGGNVEEDKEKGVEVEKSTNDEKTKVPLIVEPSIPIEDAMKNEVEKSTNDEKTEVPLVVEPSIPIEDAMKNEVEKSTNDEKTEVPLIVEPSIPIEDAMKTDVSNGVTNS